MSMTVAYDTGNSARKLSVSELDSFKNYAIRFLIAT